MTVSRIVKPHSPFRRARTRRIRVRRLMLRPCARSLSMSAGRIPHLRDTVVLPRRGPNARRGGPGGTAPSAFATVRSYGLPARAGRGGHGGVAVTHRSGRVGAVERPGAGAQRDLADVEAGA